MSTPPPQNYGSQPGGYVPPSYQPERRGPGCWVWGMLTCLVVVVIFAAIIADTAYNYFKSPEGKKLASSFGTAMKSGAQVNDAMLKMKATCEAIQRYHERNGDYPPSLAALQPDYIAGDHPFHCVIDPNPDPNHQSFKYLRPGADAPADPPVLSLHWFYTLDTGNQKQTIDTEYIMTLSGKTTINQKRTGSSSFSTTLPQSPPPPPPPLGK